MYLKLAMFVLMLGFVISTIMVGVEARRQSYHHGCGTTTTSDGTVTYNC